MPDSPSLTFAITGVDQTESMVAKINKSLFGIGKTAKQISNGPGGLSGITTAARAAGIVTRELGERGSRALERFGRAADDVGGRLGAFVPSLASLTSLATLGGLAEVTRQAASFGTGIMKSSAQVGVSTLELQKWINGMDRVGFSAENTTSMLGNVNKASLNARAGLDPAAFGIAQLKHINITGDTKETILSIADALKKMHEQGANPESEGQVLDAFGISRDHIALLEKGRQAVLDLLEARSSASGLSKKEIKQLDDLNQAYNGTGTEASNFGKKIAADLSPSLIKASTVMNDWLEELRHWPAAMKVVETAVASLGAVVTIGLVARITSFLAGVTGLKSILAGIFTGPGMAITLPLATAGDTPNNSGYRAWQSQQATLPPSQQGYTGLWHRFTNWLSGGGGGGAPSATGAGATSGGGSVASQIVSAATGAGAGRTAMQAMIAGALGEGNVTQPWKPGDNNSSFGPWQLHRGGELDRYLREGNRAGDVPAQTRYVLQRLNEISPGFSQSSDVAAQIEAVRRFESSALGNVPGSTYYSQNLPGAAGVLDRAQDNADTSHEVTINIAGAPPGSRASVTGAAGPAKLNLRTSYSMGDVW